MTLQTKPFDFAKNVRTDDDVREYLRTFFTEEGLHGLRQAINHIINADIPDSKLAGLLKEQSSISTKTMQAMRGILKGANTDNYRDRQDRI